MSSQGTQGTCSSPGSPDLTVARADQEAFNYDSGSDYSELFEILSCSGSDLSEAFLSELLPQTRTIEGSSRLYSAQNPYYLLPLGKAPLKLTVCG
jgi:hypothetical protein